MLKPLSQAAACHLIGSLGEEGGFGHMSETWYVDSPNCCIFLFAAACGCFGVLLGGSSVGFYQEIKLKPAKILLNHPT